LEPFFFGFSTYKPLETKGFPETGLPNRILASVCNSGQSSATFAKQLPNILRRGTASKLAADAVFHGSSSVWHSTSTCVVSKIA